MHHFQRQRLINALTTLGDTSQEVYEKLLALGHFGHRTGNWSCPVFRYLRDTCDMGEVQFGVCEETVRFYETNSQGDYLPRITIPYSVQWFITDFDAGRYPALVVEKQ